MYFMFDFSNILENENFNKKEVLEKLSNSSNETYLVEKEELSQIKNLCYRNYFVSN